MLLQSYISYNLGLKNLLYSGKILLHDCFVQVVCFILSHGRRHVTSGLPEISSIVSGHLVKGWPPGSPLKWSKDFDLSVSKEFFGQWIFQKFCSVDGILKWQEQGLRGSAPDSLRVCYDCSLGVSVGSSQWKWVCLWLFCLLLEVCPLN